MVVVGPVDPIGLIRLIGETAEWVAKVVSTRKNKREQRAAYLLREAGIVVGAMHSLDRGINKLLSPLVRLDASWSNEQRQEIFDQLNEFVRDFTIVHAVRNSELALEELSKGGELDRDITEAIERPVGRLAYHAVSFLRTVNPDFGFHEFNLANTELEDLWRRLANASDDDQMISIAREIQHRIPQTHQFVLEAMAEFGVIRGVILNRYPAMPAPLWADKLP